jgi:hypothetical protein
LNFNLKRFVILIITLFDIVSAVQWGEDGVLRKTVGLQHREDSLEHLGTIQIVSVCDRKIGALIFVLDQTQTSISCTITSRARIVLYIHTFVINRMRFTKVAAQSLTFNTI